MKNVKKCGVCKSPKVRVNFKGKMVDGNHNEWADERTCPSCSPKREVKVKIECTGCAKSVTKHFKEQTKCHACHSASLKQS